MTLYTTKIIRLETKFIWVGFHRHAMPAMEFVNSPELKTILANGILRWGKSVISVDPDAFSAEGLVRLKSLLSGLGFPNTTLICEPRWRYWISVPSRLLFVVAFGFVIGSMVAYRIYAKQALTHLGRYDATGSAITLPEPPKMPIQNRVLEKWEAVLSTPVHWIQISVQEEGMRGEGYFQGEESVVFQPLSLAFPKVVFYSPAPITGTNWTQFILERSP